MLDHGSPFELLVATILAAQCTDERVNMVTPALFRRFPTPQAMGAADIAELEGLIRSTGFFHNKAKSIKGASQALTARFPGTFPKTMEDLLTLPGVGTQDGERGSRHLFRRTGDRRRHALPSSDTEAGPREKRRSRRDRERAFRSSASTVVDGIFSRGDIPRQALLFGPKAGPRAVPGVRLMRFPGHLTENGTLRFLR